MSKTVNLSIICVYLCLLTAEVRAQTPCQIDLLANPETGPLVVRVVNGTFSFPDPTATDNRTLDVLYEEELVFACPGGQLSQPGLNTRGQRGLCQGGTGFIYDNFPYDYSTLSCTTTESTRPALGETYDSPDYVCESPNTHVQVGYKIDGTLAPVYDVCYNSDSNIATYTRHRLTRFAPLAESTARSPPTRFFFLLELYNKDVQSVYDNIEFFFEKMGVESYLNDTYFLTAGHLAPYEDFFHQFQRDAAYHYVNVAPQWNTFDEGNWRVLEDGVLQLMANGQTSEGGVISGDATVLTGTLKVATLVSNITGTFEPVELILRYGKFPVPRWFWKVVYFPDSVVGVVFFGFNNPYADPKADIDTEFLAEICTVDVFEDVRTSWYLDNVDNTNAAMGYMYACRLSLAEIVDPTISTIVGNLLSAKVREAELFPQVF